MSAAESSSPTDPPSERFQVRLRSPETPPEIPEAAPEGEDYSLDEIEAAYLKALESADVAEAVLPDEAAGWESEETEKPLADDPAAAPKGTDAGAPERTEPPAAATFQAAPLGIDQVIEALLFVGGEPISSKRLVEVLGGAQGIEVVEEALDRLRRSYAEQGRPYEIRLVEGGYRLQLREAFEPVRRRVYGQGPKEVKLSQDALEVLAFVAYQQPVTREQVEGTGKVGAAQVLRQLLRRELITLDRPGKGEPEVYRTTPRFLELFGLSAIADLPQAGELQFR